MPTKPTRIVGMCLLAAVAGGASMSFGQAGSEGSNVPAQSPSPAPAVPPSGFKPSKGLSGGLGGVKSVGPKKTKLGGVKSKAGPRISLPSPSARLPKPRPEPRPPVIQPAGRSASGGTVAPGAQLPRVGVIGYSGERRRRSDFLFRPFGALAPVPGYYKRSGEISTGGLEANGSWDTGSFRGVFSLNSPNIVEWDQPCAPAWGYASSVYDANMGIYYDEDCDGCDDPVIVGDPRYFGGDDGMGADPFLVPEHEKQAAEAERRQAAEAALAAVDRGRLLLMRGDAPGAAAALEEHLKSDPTDFESMRLLGVSLLESRKPREAAAVMAMAYENEPGLASRSMRDDVQVSADRWRELVRRGTTFANASKSGSGWLVVAALMHAEGRNSDALRMVAKGRACGLSERVAQELEIALSPAATGPAAQTGGSGSKPGAGTAAPRK